MVDIVVGGAFYVFLLFFHVSIFYLSVPIFFFQRFFFHLLSIYFKPNNYIITIMIITIIVTIIKIVMQINIIVKVILEKSSGGDLQARNSRGLIYHYSLC